MIAQSGPSEYVLGGLSWFLPAVLLIASAALVARRRGARPSYLLAACVAFAVAAWQVFLSVISLAGPGSPGPFLLVVKLGVLVAVVGVDLAAALLLLRSRSRVEEGALRPVRAPRRLSTDVSLLVVAAAAYVVSMPLLFMTG